MSTATATPTKTLVQPYLNFDGRCEEALEFYRKELGAEIEVIMRFQDAPPDSQCPGSDGNKVMHSSFKIGDSSVMASDCEGQGKPSFQGISLSLAVPSVEEAERYFNALANGGKVQMPLNKTFWSPGFGVVCDKFGVSWMINTCGEQSCV